MDFKPCLRLYPLSVEGNKWWWSCFMGCSLVKTRNHFLSQFCGEVQRIPNFFFFFLWLLIVSRARHVFGTGRGIIQQGHSPMFPQDTNPWRGSSKPWLLHSTERLQPAGWDREWLRQTGKGFPLGSREGAGDWELIIGIKMIKFCVLAGSEPAQSSFPAARRSKREALLWSFHQLAAPLECVQGWDSKIPLSKKWGVQHFCALFP